MDQISANHRQLLTRVTSNKEGMETEMHKIVKGIKMIVEEEVKNSETSPLSEIHFMEQLQSEIQQELKSFHTDTQESICKLSKTVEACNAELTKLTTYST